MSHHKVQLTLVNDSCESGGAAGKLVFFLVWKPINCPIVPFSPLIDRMSKDHGLLKNLFI